MWSSEYLPLVQRIMNAKVHDTIGVSQAKLVFGKSLNLYTGPLLPIPPESLIKGTADVTEHRLSDHVARLIKEASPLSDMSPVNSYVLLKPPDGAREKLRMPKAGPYIVVGISGDRHDSSSGLDPTEVAARNAGEFFIDRISDTEKTYKQGIPSMLERLLSKGRHLGTV